MQYLNEHNILIFLQQILLLLVIAKVLGTLCTKIGVPALVGEILTGILLGPTLFGKFAPALQMQVFPTDVVQQNMLETISWFGILFLLLVTGFEVNISSAVKRGKEALSVGIMGVVIPFGIGFLAFWWMPDTHYGANATRLTHTLFLATAASISALAIIARVLHDLNILKSDLGVTILSGYFINELVGWAIFSVVLSLVTQHGATLFDTARTLAFISIFAVACLTVGSRAVDTLSRKIQESTLPHPATILTFVTSLALLCGAITQWSGVHAILGFFLAGVMVGNTSEISDRTREIITQMVQAIFVPIFFASIGLKVDFASSFQPGIVGIFLAVAVGGKFLGALLGAVALKVPRKEALSIAIAFTPGGAMEIILGTLALELKLIDQIVFVAIVFGALLSSIAVGPLLAWSIRATKKHIRIGAFLRKNAIALNLDAADRYEAISQMCQLVSAAWPNLDRKLVEQIVLEREAIMGTGLDRGIAVPHGRLPGLKSPLIAFGRLQHGVDWDARDGNPAHLIFLILTPEHDRGMQLSILAAIAKCTHHREFQEELETLENPVQLFTRLKASFDSTTTQ